MSVDYRDRGVLERLYTTEQKTLNEIADLAGVNAITIRNWMNRLGIRIRSVSESRMTARFQDALTENRSEYCNEKRLRDLYVKAGLSGGQIGRMAGVDRHTVVCWLRAFRIPVRSSKESKNTEAYRESTSGVNHPNYKDGKRAIRSGWGYKMIVLYGRARACHRCNLEGRIPEHVYVMEKYINRKLTDGETVHHVNFDRLDNRLANLILFPSQAEHNRYHKYLERVGAFHLGILSEMPEYQFTDGTVVGTQT